MLLVVLEPSLGPGVVSCGIQTFLSSLQVSGKEGEMERLSIFLWLWFSFGKRKRILCICLYLHTYRQIFIGGITSITFIQEVERVR